MPMLTGSQGTDLAYLAEFPDASDAEEIALGMSGPARELALALIGKNPDPSPEVQETARAMKEWARQKFQ